MGVFQGPSRGPPGASRRLQGPPGASRAAPSTSPCPIFERKMRHASTNYIALNRAPNIDCYWGWAVPNLNPFSAVIAESRVRDTNLIMARTVHFSSVRHTKRFWIGGYGFGFRGCSQKVGPKDFGDT